MSVVAERQPVILVVDDENVVRRLVNMSLGKEYSIVTADNGCKALEMMRTVRVDMVMTDIRMPEMDGIDLADELIRAYPRVPIAFLSGSLDENTRREAEQRSPHLIDKPFDMHDLRTAVREILRERHVDVVLPPEQPGA